MKKALVVSGGGAKGAFATGVIDYLYNKLNNRYDLIVGVSTGSLVMPLTALGLIDKLKRVYTSVDNKDLWDFNPFNSDGSINAFKIFWREIRGKSWGDMGGLRRIIKSWFTEEDYQKIIDNNIEMVACAINMNTGEKEYFSNFHMNYDYFVEAMMASAAYPVFTETVSINGYDFSDGGIREHVPLQYAIDRGCQRIDVIVHRPKQFLKKSNKVKSGISQLSRIIELQNYEISENDINQYLETREDVQINVVYTPKILTENSINFIKKDMIEWQILGYETAAYIFGDCSLSQRKVACEKYFRRRKIKPNKK